MTISFSVPGEPVPKARARIYFNKHLGHAMAYTPKKTMSWENMVASTAAQYCPKSGIITGPVKLTLRIFRSIPKSTSKKDRLRIEGETLLPTKKPDSSNILKSVEDALNNVIWLDDSQICDHVISKRYSGTPRVEIVIEWQTIK